MSDFFDQDMSSMPLLSDAQGYVNPYQHPSQMSPLAGVTGTFAPTLHGPMPAQTNQALFMSPTLYQPTRASRQTGCSCLGGIEARYAQQLCLSKLESIQKDVAPVSEIRTDVTSMRREVQGAFNRLEKLEAKIDALGQAIEQIQLSLAGFAGRFEDLQNGLRAFSADCHAWFARLGKEADEILGEQGRSGAASAPPGGGTPSFDFMMGQHVTDMNDQINSFNFG
ncbi:hypothetical protein PFICI_05951 [Pestalotiopsis fici W106-1]|uniref:Uncharacterized protein n=1 Tax=Pestalotiopsis fici (strain W106-1 / CGMCC3.15140) TaxID=1229662 RepID=W3XDE7_PESFW|nr:uncharacterized protein PFICI_05951 [Pestalotiopsis fici W106-1]ETS84075.1 hypothetical protein PFICI_05951 [Pestalotiopsis fici W106-1]